MEKQQSKEEQKAVAANPANTTLVNWQIVYRDLQIT